MNMPDQQSAQVSGQMSGPLTEILTHGPVPIETLVRWGAQLARELAAAHEVGRVHGNVRAAVVSVGVDGAARLSGFNEPGSGPVAHPAPELADGGVPTRASDIFALGAVLYEAAAGVDPRLMPLWTAMGHADPAQRPTASQVAERLDRLDEKKPRRRRKALIVTGIAVLAVLAVLAGLAVVNGTWSTTRRPTAAPSEWKDPVGDLRTADPCALLDANAMQRFGATRLYPDVNAFNSCTMQIRPSANERVNVSATIVNPLADDDDLASVRTQRIGALSLYLGRLHNEEETQTTCQRILLLPNRARIGLKVWNESIEKKTDLCAVADAEVQVELRVLNTSGLPRRNATGPPNSLVGVDACALVDEPTLRTIPGLELDRRSRTDGTWSCEWGEDPQVADPPTVWISMSRGFFLPNGEATTIGGRAATVDSTSSDNAGISCQIALTQRSYQGIYDDARVEMLLVWVHLNVAALPDAQCAAARTIAEAAAAKLPPPS